ncbi:MAG TPA: mycofactocin biosynthesis glycosyltransferase MftF, partial [Ilumatobacteraceae bacterium]|nr:mycofactocin biosynthesis glycosyltransferase MftF [Ilumatobacteraceae bacterium]
MVDVTTPQTASISVDRFELDRSYRRVARGAAIIGGSPLRVFRLSSAGQRVAAAIESGAALPAGHGRLTARLVAAGAIHPRPVSSPFTAADVTIVHPVFGDLPPLAQRGSPVIVVDDASSPAVHIDPPVRLIRLDVNRGPAAARNAALDHVTTPLVAFVDADVTVTDGLHDADTWLDPLLTHFTDPSVALVAPRVASVPVTTVVGRYEASRSPLDLGDQPARIAPGTRVSYVPAAAIVCRTEAIREVGGFETSMRSGEDVDLVWRLLEAGWTARYEPRSVVHHRPRATIATVLRQRFFYGTSAAALEARHPGALPLRIEQAQITIPCMRVEP